MNLLDIKAVMTADAANAAKTPDEVAAWFNAKTQPGVMPSSALADYIFVRGFYAKIVLLSQNVAVPVSQREAAIDALAVLAIRDRLVDYSRSAVKARLAAVMDELIAGGAMDAAGKTFIIGIGDNKVSRAEVNNFPEIRAHHIIEARAA